MDLGGSAWQKTSEELQGGRAESSSENRPKITPFSSSLDFSVLVKFRFASFLCGSKGGGSLSSLEACWEIIPDQWVGSPQSWHASWQAKSWSVDSHQYKAFTDGLKAILMDSSLSIILINSSQGFNWWCSLCQIWALVDCSLQLSSIKLYPTNVLRQIPL